MLIRSLDEPIKKQLSHGFSRPALQAFTLALMLSACSSPYTVSINNTAVFDPQDRLYTGEVRSADLQGCNNFALRQQKIESDDQLQVLACANSEVTDLANISRLQNLRFIDLGKNRISNLTPLERLDRLSGLNLSDNLIEDISPLLRIQTLRSLNLAGNDSIPCRDVTELTRRMGANFTAPSSCKP